MPALRKRRIQNCLPTLCNFLKRWADEPSRDFPMSDLGPTMNLFPLKATSTYIKAYYAALVQFHQGGHKTEGNTRSAFADVLKRCASAYEWHLVEEYQFKGTGK